MGFDRLPYELVEHIFSLGGEFESRDLCALALAGSSLLTEISRQWLYRSIDLRHAWTRRRLDAFLATVDSTQLGELTTSLELGLDAPVDDSELFDKDIMLALFKTLPNIRKLRVGNSALKLAPSLRRANVLNKVHTLLVDYKLDAKPTRLRNFCDKLPALSEVTIVMYASRKQPQPPARVEACTKSLQRLTLEQDRGARPAPFDLFLQLFDKRQELFVHAVHVCTYVQLPPRYPDLHRFSLPQAHLITSFELFVHAAVPPFMPKLRNLQKFSLVMVSKSGIVDHSVFDRMVLEGLLPTSIQHLKLRCDGYTSDYLPDLLAAHDRAPGLKSVSLDFRLGSKEARDELGAQLHKRGVSLDISTNVF